MAEDEVLAIRARAEEIQKLVYYQKLVNEPHYRGPYTIFGQKKKGNYQVQYALGSLLKTDYHRHKIKVVPPPEEEDTEHYEVEKILKNRRSATTIRKFCQMEKSSAI